MDIHPLSASPSVPSKKACAAAATQAPAEGQQTDTRDCYWPTYIVPYRPQAGEKAADAPACPRPASPAAYRGPPAQGSSLKADTPPPADNAVLENSLRVMRELALRPITCEGSYPRDAAHAHIHRRAFECAERGRAAADACIARGEESSDGFIGEWRDGVPYLGVKTQGTTVVEGEFDADGLVAGKLTIDDRIVTSATGRPYQKTVDGCVATAQTFYVVWDA